MIEVKDVSMTYKRGKKVALKNINLNIQSGEFTALLGQNGAGKTTLINILGGNVQKTTGTVKVGGYDLDKNPLEIKRILGIVPQEMGFNDVFTVEELLKHQSGYFGIRHNKEHMDYLLEELSLQDKRKSTIRQLSGGMKRRFFIAKALVHKPKILILDEPTAGVDIELRHTMYNFLNKLHKQGTTMILTTHYIEEAERLCKRVAVINRGEIIADESKEKLMEVAGQDVEIQLEFHENIQKDTFEFLHKYKPKIINQQQLSLKANKKELDKVLKLINDREIHFQDINIVKPKLEDIYLDLINP